MNKIETTQKINDTKKPPLWKVIIFACVLLVFVALIYILSIEQNKPDPASEAAICRIVGNQLHKDPNELTNEDFASINMLLLNEMWLSDIKLLKKFTNLEYLALGDIRLPENKIPNWKKILAKLGIFNLNKRPALDLKPLEKLQKLNTLAIAGTQVKYFESLAKLKNLEQLHIAFIEVSDFEPLKKLKNLKTLNLMECPYLTDEKIEDLQKALPELEIILVPSPIN